jgi:hypothetical protein
MPPEQVGAMLNALFSLLEDLTELHGCEKVNAAAAAAAVARVGSVPSGC